MRVKLNVRRILFCVVLSVLTFLKVSGQSQQHPPKFLSSDFLFQNWTVEDGLPVNSISSIVQHFDNYLWLGTADGLVRFDGVKFKVYNTVTNSALGDNRIKSMVSTGDGLLILTSNMEFILFRENEFIHVKKPVYLEGKQFFEIRKSYENQVLIVTVDAQTYAYKDGSFKETDYIVHNLKRFEGDYSWEAYGEDLYYKDELIFNINDQINNVTVDNEGTVWIATYSKGIYQIKRNLFKTFSVSEGLPDRNIYPITEDNSGTIWIGTHGKGIASLSNNEIVNGYLFQGISSNRFIQSILQRNNGDLLVALLNGEIFRYTGEKIFESYLTPIKGKIYSMYETTDQTLWVGTSSGLYYQKNMEWEKVNDPLIINSSVKVITEAPDNSLWIGTQGKGLIHLQKATVHQIEKKQGLNSNSIRSIWIESDSISNSYTLWAGSEGNGLNVLSIEKGTHLPTDDIISITTKDGLHDDVIHQIIPDEYDRIWMSSNQGIFWIFKHDVTLFSNKVLKTITSTSFTEKDGLRSREANGGIQPAGFKDGDGIIWFPTQDGIVKVDPNIITRNTEIPRTYIEEVQSLGQLFDPVPSKIELAIGDRDVKFTFTVLSFSSPEKNRFRYRLFNYDNEWQESVNKRSIRYTNLDPGTYRFKVMASNNDGVWNQQGDTVSIVIPAYFYEAVWFYILIVIILLIQIAVAFLIMKARAEKNLLDKNGEIQELESQLSTIKSQFKDHKSLKKSLLNNLKKELKEPVISLRSQLEESNEELPQTIEKETKKMLFQIDQLLLFSEIELQGLTIEPKLENLVDVVKSGIIIHKNSAPLSDPVIELSSNTESVFIYMDIEYVLIILRNLFKNLSSHDGVSKIRIEIIEESSICTIKIKDDGIALSHEELHSIFNLFQNKNTSSENPVQFGVGLPLAAKLAELHKATIVVHSVPDSGNTFSLVFRKGTLHFHRSEVLN